MATVRDGAAPAHQGTPGRQAPRPARQGQAAGLDPTVQQGQTPSEIVGGIAQSYSTGAPGTAGATAPEPDVTLEKGQLSEDYSIGVPDQAVVSSGAPGSQGSAPGSGGERVTYTDPWAIIGGVTREQSVNAHLNGTGDWTEFNADGYSDGPTLPGLTNSRPTSSGAGQGRVRGAAHPDAGH